MKGFRKLNSHCVDLRPFFETEKLLSPLALAKHSNLVAHVEFPSTMLPKWQKHLQHKLHSQPHLPMETTSYGKAWRAFRKQNSGLSSTTYYSTVPITCTQIRIHQTQSLHYDKSLKCSSLRHIVTTNFAARIYHLLCEILLQRSLTRTISRREIAKIVRIFRWFIVSMRCFADYRQ